MISTLFDVSLPTVNEHLKSVYGSGELERIPTIWKFQIVQTKGNRQVTREIEHYSLDAIITVGAIQVLRTYAIQGYVIDRNRMENGVFLNEDYFEKLLEES